MVFFLLGHEAHPQKVLEESLVSEEASRKAGSTKQEGKGLGGAGHLGGAA